MTSLDSSRTFQCESLYSDYAGMIASFPQAVLDGSLRVQDASLCVACIYNKGL
jgi:hypothetical protein